LNFIEAWQACRHYMINCSVPYPLEVIP